MKNTQIRKGCYGYFSSMEDAELYMEKRTVRDGVATIKFLDQLSVYEVRES